MMNMLKIKARDILHFKPEDVWALDSECNNKLISLEFDDGTTVDAPVRATIFSWYFWSQHRAYPAMKLLPRHHIGNRPLVDGVENELCSVVQRDAILTVGRDINMDEACKRLFMETINAMYNDMAERLEEYVTTTNIRDIIFLLDYPPIFEANQQCIRDGYGDAALKHLFEVVKNILLNDPNLDNNTVAILVRQGLVKVNQVLQAICHRGSVQEINSQIYPAPILENYGEGVHDLANSMMDSRSGTLASVNTTKPLQTSEYTNRKIQLVAMYVEDFCKEEDCGTKHHVKFHVDKKSLGAVDGCYHILDNGELELITPDSKHLIGTTIRLRNPAACAHKHGAYVCKTCFGMLSYSIPARTNLGWACATELCSGISQSVLSTKHLNFHANAKLLQLIIDSVNPYFNNSKKEPEIVVDAKWAKHAQDLNLAIAMDSFVNLADVYQVADIKEVSEAKISSVQVVGMVKGKEDITNPATWVEVGTQSNNSTFTLEFLDYLRNAECTMSEDQSVMYVNLKGWDFGKAVVRQRLRHENPLDFVKRLKYLIEGVEEDRKSSKKANAMGYDRLLDCNSPTQAVNMMHDVISTKIDYHLSMAGVLVRSLTIKDPYSRDFRLTSSDEPFFIGKYSDLMKGRSISAAMAFQEQSRTIFSLDTYLKGPRPSHPLDWLFLAVGRK